MKPKRSHIFFACTERLDYTFHHMYTFGWMTKLYFSTNNGWRTWKNSVWWIGVKTHCVILVDIRNINRQMIENKIELFCRKYAGW